MPARRPADRPRAVGTAPARAGQDRRPGKSRSSPSALKHRLSARKPALPGDENPDEFRAFAAALKAELAPWAGSRPIGWAGS